MNERYNIMKTWIHKIAISASELDRELNAFSEQGYLIFKIWRCGYDNYEIVAYRHKTEKSTPQLEKEHEEWLNKIQGKDL